MSRSSHPLLSCNEYITRKMTQSMMKNGSKPPENFFPPSTVSPIEVLLPLSVLFQSREAKALGDLVFSCFKIVEIPRRYLQLSLPFLNFWKIEFLSIFINCFYRLFIIIFFIVLPILWETFWHIK